MTATNLAHTCFLHSRKKGQICRQLISACTASAALCISTPSEASIVWRGDFETGNTSQWSYLLNESGISVNSEPALEGAHAARIEITNKPEHIWSNGLNRVELKYAPNASETKEGADFYFGWAFMLPALLTEDEHQIAYLESEKSFQQMMSFIVRGSAIRFSTRAGGYNEHWLARDALTAGTWHDLALQIHWSKDEALGMISVWFDGVRVVSEARAQTLNDDNAHFIQLGLLRDTIEPTETIFIDNARHGTELQDVLNARVATAGAGPQQPPVAAGGSPASNAFHPLQIEETGCSYATPHAHLGKSLLSVFGVTLIGLFWRRRRSVTAP